MFKIKTVEYLKQKQHFLFKEDIKPDSYLSFTEAVTRSCSVKKCSLKFRKIHRKAPVPDSLF